MEKDFAADGNAQRSADLLEGLQGPRTRSGIPVLDGGHIFILAMEGVSRRDFSLQIKERMMFVGFALLMTLMVTVIYNDLTRTWVERFMIWR